MILGINTGSEKNSIALFWPEKISKQVCWASYHASPRLRVASHAQSRELLPKIDKLLKKNRIKLFDLNVIAVYQGPGSFTGLRVGISVANALAWGLDIPVVGIKNSNKVISNKAIEIAKKAEKIYQKSKNKSAQGGSALCGKFSKIVIPYYGSQLK